MAQHFKFFVLVASIIVLASSCGSSSKEQPNTAPADSTTVFNDSTAAA